MLRSLEAEILKRLYLQSISPLGICKVLAYLKTLQGT